jgi:aminoglycoside phosphotransferase (APT) family kinase protein
MDDVDEFATGFTAWLRHEGSRGTGVRAAVLHRPGVGYASNTFLVDLEGGSGDGRIVLRLPPARDTHLGETLRRQVGVQNALAAAGIPAPSPAMYEPDARWLGHRSW